MNPEIIGLLVLLAPIVGAFVLGSRHKRLRPQCRPFVWGYWNALGIFLTPLIIIGQLREANQTTLRLVFLFVVVIYFPLAILTLRRNRWGFVALTALSFNPILWIINTIYIKNRWTELEFGMADAPPKFPQPMTCDQPGCSAAIAQTGSMLGRVSYRCSVGHEFTRNG